MTKEEFFNIYNKYHEDEYLEFAKIENQLSMRPDMHAFILLDKLVPGFMDIVSSAEHDQIWLDTSVDELCENITEEQILELIRSGVILDEENESLFMFA